MTKNNSTNCVKELQAVLKKYSAVITARDHYDGYAECRQDVRMTLEFYDGDIDLGSYLDCDKTI